MTVINFRRFFPSILVLVCIMNGVAPSSAESSEGDTPTVLVTGSNRGIGLEFARQAAPRGHPLDHVICCAGGGGLSTGVALAFEGLSGDTKIWAAEPEGHDDWARSLAAGEIIANVGDSGGQPQSGVYFEIRSRGKPVNPSKWCSSTARHAAR